MKTNIWMRRGAVAAVLAGTLIVGAGGTAEARPHGGPARIPGRLVGPVHVMNPEGFYKRLTIVKGRDLTQDEIKACTDVFQVTRGELMKARRAAAEKLAGITGLSAAECEGVLPVPGADLGDADQALVQKLAKSGRKLTTEQLAQVRATLRDLDRATDGIREAMCEGIAKAAGVRKSEVEDILPKNGFPVWVFRVRPEPGDKPEPGSEPEPAN
jgi:hypothetical protein